MEQNDQNRSFTVSSKVSSSQKAMYMQEAKKLNLSLSEWICGTLDMSLNAYQEVDKLEMIKQLQEDNDKKSNIINGLKFMIKNLRALLQQKQQIIEQLVNANSESERVVHYSRKIKK